MSAHSSYKLPSPLNPIFVPWAKERNLEFYIKRDDLIHTAVSGNKWRKLKFNILQAKHLKKKGILTFGGAYSNHILATAHACKINDLSSLAIIRGDELNSESNSILKQCADWGMEFRFISREEYNLKDDFEYLNEMKSEYREYYIIPEGGKNFFGIVGCQEIVKEIQMDFDAIWLAQGTCTTSIGVAMTCPPKAIVHAVPALKGFDSAAEIEIIMKRQGLDHESVNDVLSGMEFHPDFHFGGYGKTTDELTRFISNIREEMDIPLDKVYTGKAFYAMLDYYKNSAIENKKVIFLHTGGLIAGKV